MNKYIKYGIIIIIFIIALSIINKVMKPNMDTQITNHLINKGFEKSEYGLFIKEDDDENSKTLFSIADYSLMKNIDENDKGVNYSLNATYYYKNNNLIYSYRVTYNNSYNVYFKGEYDGENFICEKEFSNATLTSKERENICSLAKTNVKTFFIDAKSLFSNNYINYMKQK